MGSPAADYSKTTDPKNHFFCQVAAAYTRNEGGQVAPVLARSMNARSPYNKDTPQ